MDYKTSFIASIEQNNDTKSFRFSRPPGFNFQAGQFFSVAIKEKLAKHFSFSNSPTEEGFIELTTKMTGSEFKNALNALKEGETVGIKGPFGTFTYDPAFKKIAFLSGGIGITPIRSICKYLTDMNVECDVILLYGNNREEDITFRKDFEEMASKLKRLRFVNVLSSPKASWSGYRGFINSDVLLKEMSDFKERVFYICGPPGMVLAMVKLLEGLTVAPESIKRENFAGY
jgi:ferredoxin-NADP reductase